MGIIPSFSNQTFTLSNTTWVRRHHRRNPKNPKVPRRGQHQLLLRRSSNYRQLAAITGKKEANRGEVTKELWAYLKKHNLQDPENKQFFTPDKKMAKIFGKEKIKAFTMSKFLNPHLKEISA